MHPSTENMPKQGPQGSRSWFFLCPGPLLAVVFASLAQGIGTAVTKLAFLIGMCVGLLQVRVAVTPTNPLFRSTYTKQEFN